MFLEGLLPFSLNVYERLDSAEFGSCEVRRLTRALVIKCCRKPREDLWKSRGSMLYTSCNTCHGISLYTTITMIYIILKGDLIPKFLRMHTFTNFPSRKISNFSHACQAFHTSLPQYLSDDIEHIQKRALRITYQHLSYTANTGNLKRADLETLYERRTMLCE